MSWRKLLWRTVASTSPVTIPLISTTTGVNWWETGGTCPLCFQEEGQYINHPLKFWLAVKFKIVFSNEMDKIVRFVLLGASTLFQKALPCTPSWHHTLAYLRIGSTTELLWVFCLWIIAKFPNFSIMNYRRAQDVAKLQQIQLRTSIREFRLCLWQVTQWADLAWVSPLPRMDRCHSQQLRKSYWFNPRQRHSECLSVKIFEIMNIWRKQRYVN